MAIYISITKVSQTDASVVYDYELENYEPDPTKPRRLRRTEPTKGRLEFTWADQAFAVIYGPSLDHPHVSRVVRKISRWYLDGSFPDKGEFAA